MTKKVKSPKLPSNVKSKERKDQLGEVFTPPELVNEILDHIPEECWSNPNKTTLDPTCGNGNFLVEVFKRMAKYHSKEHILSKMLYGVDIMEDNCKEAIARLYGEGEITNAIIPDNFKTDGIKGMFNHNGKLVINIIQADGLIYNYGFGEIVLPDNLNEELWG